MFPIIASYLICDMLSISINWSLQKIWFWVVISIYVEFLFTSRGSLFSSLFLCRIIDIACCIAMVLISVKVCLTVSFGILNFSSKIFIEGI